MLLLQSERGNCGLLGAAAEAYKLMLKPSCMNTPRVAETRG